MTNPLAKTQYKSHLVKRYHTLCTRIGMTSDDKRAILDSFGAASSLDLQSHELAQINKDLEKLLNPKKGELDMWRKRVIASIGGWLNLMHIDNDIEKIKAIARRATGNQFESFNKIPIARLVNLYNAFLNKQKDFKTVGKITKEELEILENLN